MKFRILMIYLVFGTFISLFSQYASADGKITIAFDEANPPFMYANADKVAGVYPNLIETVFKKMGQPVELKTYPWKRALELGDKGEVGIGGIYKNEARLKIYDYSAPIFDEKLNIYVKKGNRFAFKNVSDLKNKSIGVIRGWSYGDDFDKGKKEQLFKVEENSSDELNFKKLLADRLDCVIAIEQSADSVISKLGSHNQVEALDIPLAVNPTYLVFAKQQNKQGIIEQFNKTLMTMKQDGSYQTLIKVLFQQNTAK